MYGSGNHSMNSILDWVTGETRLRSKTGKSLRLNTIEFILHNPFYCGIAFSKKYNTFTPHKYQAIITEKLFEKCQSVCSENRVKPIKINSRDFIFKGVCTCDVCGCSYSPEMHKKKSGKSFIYYSCTN